MSIRSNLSLGLFASSALLLPNSASAQEATFSACEFIRGDANADGKVNMTDVLYLSDFLQGSLGSEPLNLDALDFNDSGDITGKDLDYLIKFTSIPGSRIPLAPFPLAGYDPTLDGLMSVCDNDYLNQASADLIDWIAASNDSKELLETPPMLVDMIFFDIDGDGLEEAVSRFNGDDQFTVFSVDSAAPALGFREQTLAPIHAQFGTKLVIKQVAYLATYGHLNDVEVHVEGAGVMAPIFSGGVGDFDICAAFDERVVFAIDQSATILAQDSNGQFELEVLPSMPFSGAVVYAFERPGDKALIFGSGYDEFIAWDGIQFTDVTADFAALPDLITTELAWQSELNRLGDVLAVESHRVRSKTITWSLELFKWVNGGKTLAKAGDYTLPSIPDYVLVQPSGIIATSQVGPAGISPWTMAFAGTGGIAMQAGTASTNDLLQNQAGKPAVPTGKGGAGGKETIETACGKALQTMLVRLDSSHPMTGPICKVIDFAAYLGGLEDSGAISGLTPEDKACIKALKKIAASLNKMKSAGQIYLFPTQAEFEAKFPGCKGLAFPTGTTYTVKGPDGKKILLGYAFSAADAAALCDPNSDVFWSFLATLLHEGAHGACGAGHPGANNKAVELLAWMLHSWDRITPPTVGGGIIWPTPDPGPGDLPPGATGGLKKAKTNQKVGAMVLTSSSVVGKMRDLCESQSIPFDPVSLMHDLFEEMAGRCPQLPDSIPEVSGPGGVPGVKSGPMSFEYDPDGSGPMPSIKITVLCVDGVFVGFTFDWGCGSETVMVPT